MAGSRSASRHDVRSQIHTHSSHSEPSPDSVSNKNTGSGLFPAPAAGLMLDYMDNYQIGTLSNDIIGSKSRNDSKAT